MIKKTPYLILWILLLLGCRNNKKALVTQILLASKDSCAWDWDEDDMCESGNYPCRGTTFYKDGSYKHYRYFKNELDTSHFDLKYRQPWSCMPNSQTWQLLSDSTILIDLDTCKILHTSTDSFVYSLKRQNYTRNNIMRYVKAKI
jgi:hypothetical protein